MKLQAFIKTLPRISASSSDFYLVCFRGLDEGEICSLKNRGKTTIGRDQNNDLVLDLQAVSQKHAEITRLDDSGYFLIHDRSKNGIWLDGCKVAERAIAKPGSIIQVSKDSLIIVPASGNLSLPNTGHLVEVVSELHLLQFGRSINAPYIGQHARLDQRVGNDDPIMVKYLRREWFCSQDSECDEVMKKRLKFAHSVQHPSCVNVLETGKDGNEHYWIERFVSSTNVQQKLESRGSIDKALVGKWISQLSEALAYLREQHDVYAFTDLNPSGMLITGNADLQLIHFAAAGIAGMSYRASLPKYWEGIVDGERAVEPSWELDCMLIGLLAWEMATGRSSGQFVKNAKTLSDCARLPKPRKFATSFPERLEAIVMQLLSRDGTKFFSNPRQLAEALRSY